MRKLEHCTAAVAAFALVAMSPAPAMAEECYRALVVSSYQENTNSGRDVRLSQYVRESEWREISRSADANAIVYDVPLGASYDEYRLTSNERLSSLNSSLSESQARNVLWTGLDQNSLRAYEACLGANGYGLFLMVRRANPNQVTISVRYNSPAGRDIALTWTGAPESVLRQLPSRINNHSTVSRVVQRPIEGEDFILAVNSPTLDGPDGIEITAWPSDPMAQSVIRLVEGVWAPATRPTEGSRQTGVLTERCDDRPTCLFRVAVSDLGSDPYGGTRKIFTLTFNCMIGGHSVDPSPRSVTGYDGDEVRVTCPVASPPR